ncbi:MAG: hypothetical protein AB1755_03000 [Candidatus Omnitrophota bacterium]
MIYWAPFLHFYQPPTQFHAILDKICRESYAPLVKVFSEQPNTKVTINMCGVLTQMLKDHGRGDIIDGIREVAETGKLEFVDSANYHAILPLIPPREARRQIEQNHKTNSFFFKDVYKPKGFFPPEMCYSDGLASILASLGYQWCILSGVACSDNWPQDVIYKVNLGKHKLITFYRDDILSNKISFHNIESQEFIAQLVDFSKGKKDVYVITAMDAETFGHHIQNWEKLFLADVYKTLEKNNSLNKKLKHKTDLAEKHKDILNLGLEGQIQVVTISELIGKLPVEASSPPFASSWSTTRDEINQGNFYPLWKDPNNPIHTLQWEYVSFCFELVDKAKSFKSNKESGYFSDIARMLLDRAIHSCQFWWANKGRMWDINMVNKGLVLMEEVIFNASKAIYVCGSEEEKMDLNYRVLAARDVASKIRECLIKG